MFRRAGTVAPRLGYSWAFEMARLLMRFDNIASFIVNPNDSLM
jgi:hypothetical protein